MSRKQVKTFVDQKEKAQLITGLPDDAYSDFNENALVKTSVNMYTVKIKPRMQYFVLLWRD